MYLHRKKCQNTAKKIKMEAERDLLMTAVDLDKNPTINNNCVSQKTIQRFFICKKIKI